MTAWDDKWATPQAQAYAKADQRRALADEIARAAIHRARDCRNSILWGGEDELPDMGPRCAHFGRAAADWRWKYHSEFECAVEFARQTLDTRRP